MWYAQDYDGSLPWVDTVGGVSAGAAHGFWTTSTLHRDYLGGAPEFTPAQWQDGRDPARRTASQNSGRCFEGGWLSAMAGAGFWLTGVNSPTDLTG